MSKYSPARLGGFAGSKRRMAETLGRPSLSLSRLGQGDIFAVNKAVVSISMVTGEQEMILHWGSEAFLRSLEFVDANDFEKNEKTLKHELIQDSSQYVHGFKIRDLLFDQGIMRLDENNPLLVEKEAAAPTDPRVLHHLTSGLVHGVPSHCYALMKKVATEQPFFAHLCIQPLNLKELELCGDGSAKDRKESREVKTEDNASLSALPNKRHKRRVVTTYVPKILSDESYNKYYGLEPKIVIVSAGTAASSSSEIKKETEKEYNGDRNPKRAMSGKFSTANNPEAERRHDLGVTDASRGEAGRFISVAFI